MRRRKGVFANEAPHTASEHEHRALGDTSQRIGRKIGRATTAEKSTAAQGPPLKVS